jgi:hypothetical protein
MDEEDYRGNGVRWDGWHAPLFRFSLVGAYCFNCLCPWATIYGIMGYLNDTNETTAPNVTSANCAKSMLTCLLPCCLVGRSVDGMVRGGGEESNYFTAIFSTRSESNGWSEEVMAAGVGCMGALCIVPTTFELRQAVEAKYHNDSHDSIWESGLISCCAWPCALAQMREEIGHYQ